MTDRPQEHEATDHKATDHEATEHETGRTEPGPGRELLPVATAARTRAVVRDLLRVHRGLAFAALTVMTAATVIGLATAPLLGRIVDVVAEARQPGALTVPVVLLAAVAVAQGVASALGLSLVARLGEQLLARIRERFVERALHLPLDQVEKAGSGDLTARVTADVTLIGEAVRNALPELVRSLLAIGLTLAALAVLDWRFLLAALLAVPVQAHTARWYTRRAVSIYKEQRIAVGAQQQQLLDTIGGAGTVRAFRQEERHTGRVTERSRAAVELVMRGVWLVLRFYSRLHAGEFVGLAAVLVTGFLMVRGGAASIGTATAAALYFHGLFTPVNSALALIDDAQSATAGLTRLVGVADLPAPEERSPRPRPGALTAEPVVEAAGVGHAYVPGHDVLHDVDIDLAPKEHVALVGASGAGKTTLARIIAGIHRPDRGTVRLGGATLDELGPAAVRGTVALISQEVHVFAGPLADDLRLAGPEATDEDLAAALEAVGATSWVRALPEGLDTVVGDGGHRLTAAQGQQLALARLVIADPPVVILDEATAEAGSAGARALERAAASALDGRTALVVAHRLTQAAAADRVIVLDQGRVVETGSHEELVARGGRYAALWAAWSDTREPPPGTARGPAAPR